MEVNPDRNWNENLQTLLVHLTIRILSSNPPPAGPLCPFIQTGRTSRSGANALYAPKPNTLLRPTCPDKADLADIILT